MKSIFTVYLHICYHFLVADDRTQSDASIPDLAEELRLLIGRMKRQLREQSDPGDLTWSQIAVLARIDREGSATVSALARAEGIRPQSMGTIVSGLEAAGFVTGVPDPQDGRQTLLSLTPACEKMIRVGRAARHSWLSRAIETKLGPGERQELARAIQLLKRLVDS